MGNATGGVGTVLDVTRESRVAIREGPVGEPPSLLLSPLTTLSIDSTALFLTGDYSTQDEKK